MTYTVVTDKRQRRKYHNKLQQFRWFYNDQLVNSGLRWEQSKSFEVGLDIGFLQ